MTDDPTETPGEDEPFTPPTPPADPAMMDTEPGPVPPILQQVPILVSVRIGTVKQTVRDIMAINDGTVLPLEQSIDAPVDVCVGERVVARGELIPNGDDDSVSVRITEVFAEAAP